jgi:hypothetical protein
MKEEDVYYYGRNLAKSNLEHLALVHATQQCARLLPVESNSGHSGDRRTTSQEVTRIKCQSIYS